MDRPRFNPAIVGCLPNVCGVLALVVIRRVLESSRMWYHHVLLFCGLQGKTPMQVACDGGNASSKASLTSLFTLPIDKLKAGK